MYAWEMEVGVYYISEEAGRNSRNENEVAG